MKKDPSRLELRVMEKGREGNQGSTRRGREEETG